MFQNSARGWIFLLVRNWSWRSFFTAIESQSAATV
jgi:hypothetical protein